MIDVDAFLTRTPGRGYNCFDFAREVALTYREDIADKFVFLGSDFKDRKLEAKHLRPFTRIASPVDGCFVVMQSKRRVPHIGIWLNRKVLHLAETGAMYEPLSRAARRFTKVGYFV